MSQICVNDLTFYYEGSYDNIFEHVSFRIDTDWKLGLIGRNGRGKTTLLKLLEGIYEYRGTITSAVTFEYFPFSVENQGKMTIDIVEEVDPLYELWRICRELSLMDTDAEVLYRPFETLSNGEQTKVLLAVLFAKENAFLLIDEPTNHLDLDTREIVMEYLKKKKGFLLVSHDRYFLDGCVDHILAINKDGIEICQGNFTVWQENRERKDAYEADEQERLKKEIGKLTKAAGRTAGWSDQIEKSKIGNGPVDRGYIGHQAARMMKRALVIEQRAQKAVEEKKKLLKNLEKAEELKLFPLRHHRETVIRAENLELFYGEKKVTGPLNFEVKNGEQVILRGKNGCGKSSMLKRILGEAISYRGKLEVASGLKISYVSQDAEQLCGMIDEFAIKEGVDPTLLKVLLRKLDFSRVQFEKPIESYSGGQKKKVLLAKSLCEQAHLYIWDEPLNFIDLFSRTQIEELIQTYRPTMLLVEHDRFFGEKIGARYVEIQCTQD